MSNQKWYILLLFAFVLIGCMNKSSNEDMNVAASVEMEPAASNNKDIADELIVSELPIELSEDQQKAYQLRAQQKFQDFLDYLKIVSDPKIDKGLVKHSENLIKDLFINDTVTFYDGDTILYEMIDHNNPLPLFDYIENVKIVSHREAITSKIKTAEFVKPLKKDSTDNFYNGKLQTEIILNQKSVTKIVDIYLVETTKQFGDTEQKTVEVKLGNIY